MLLCTVVLRAGVWMPEETPLAKEQRWEGRVRRGRKEREEGRKGDTTRPV